MENITIKNRLIAVKEEISKLGIDYLDSQSPVYLSDVGRVLKPFVDIGASLDKAIKKFSSNNVSGLIPKSNKLG